MGGSRDRRGRCITIVEYILILSAGNIEAFLRYICTAFQTSIHKEILICARHMQELILVNHSMEFGHRKIDQLDIGPPRLPKQSTNGESFIALSI
jgi:hypothetical protein